MSILTGIESSVKPDDQKEFCAPDEGFQEQFPGLYEFLARVKFQGKDRKVGKLFLYYDAGKAAVCLSDAHTGQVAFHLDVGLMEALEGVERRLQASKMDWRKSRKWQG